MENTPGSPKTPRKAGTRPLSVILGTLMIPLSALAAYAFVSPSPSVDETANTPEASAPIEPLLVFNSGVATPEDLAAACGPSGLALVDAENNGTITDVQEAALDALREICAGQGLALPGKAIPEPIVEQIIVQSATTAPPASTTSTPSSGDDDQSDDDSDYEDEDEDDDHDDDDDDDDEPGDDD